MMMLKISGVLFLAEEKCPARDVRERGKPGRKTMYDVSKIDRYVALRTIS
jgi:hypothetical protein